MHQFLSINITPLHYTTSPLPSLTSPDIRKLLHVEAFLSSQKAQVSLVST